MLFSQPAVATLMDERFECVWEELRPAPRVHIDFGNGIELDRTLGGNVATLFCTPDGLVYDLLPGLVDEPLYLVLLKQASNSFTELESTFADKQTLESARVQVIEQLNRHNQSAFQYFSVLTQPQLPSGIQGNSKFAVEQPIKEVVDISTDPQESSQTPYVMTDQDRINLAKDTGDVLSTKLPRALRLLANHPLCPPEELTNDLFREVLHIDLEDPYLGLAPIRLGGNLGRHGPVLIPPVKPGPIFQD